MLSGIIGVLGICLECDFCGAQGALNVEPEDLDTIVVLALDSLFPCVKLLSFVDVLATGITAPAKRRRQ